MSDMDPVKPTDVDPALEVETEEEPLVLDEDERIAAIDEDDNPGELIGEEQDDDLDYDPEAELLYPDEKEDDNGDSGSQPS